MTVTMYSSSGHGSYGPIRGTGRAMGVIVPLDFIHAEELIDWVSCTASRHEADDLVSARLGLVLGAMLRRCRERTLLALALLTAQASPSPPADRGLARKKSAPASPQAQERPSQQGW
jgi:hypothetical protein